MSVSRLQMHYYLKKSECSANQHRLLKRKHMIYILIFLSLALGGRTQGDESHCKVTGNGACIQRVTGEINGKFFKERRPCTVYYKPPNADQEVAALFSFVLSYHCQATREYVCDEEIINNTFSVSIKPGVSCKEGNFTFFTEGGQPVVCQKIKLEQTTVDTKSVPDHTTDQRRAKEDYSKKVLEWLYSPFAQDGTSNIVIVCIIAVISMCAALSASIVIRNCRLQPGGYLPLTKETKRKEQAKNISISSKYKAAATDENAEI